LRCDGGGDGLRRAIGDEGDFFVWLDAETGQDGGAGAGNEFGRVVLRKQVRNGCCKAGDDGAPGNGDTARARI
jgi:hypothetical protein